VEKDMKAALAQTHIFWENKELNFNKVISFARLAKEKAADIIFFPEMSLTGFSMNTKATAEGSSQNTIEKTRELCRNEKIAVGIGWTKRGDKKAENHYTVINRNGRICSDYVKIHPFSYAGETDYFKGGNEIRYFEMGGYTWSTFICYDLRFPEIFQIASQKADIIVVPANWPAKREEHWKTLLKARAIENQCYVLGINCVGMIENVSYSGYTSAYSPNGMCLYELSNEEGLVFVELNHEELEICNSFPVKKDRKWKLYSEKYKEL